LALLAQSFLDTLGDKLEDVAVAAVDFLVWLQTFAFSAADEMLLLGQTYVSRSTTMKEGEKRGP
jgi:hypothetical protein